jgi:hypothetical protein
LELQVIQHAWEMNNKPPPEFVKGRNLFEDLGIDEGIVLSHNRITIDGVWIGYQTY